MSSVPLKRSRHSDSSGPSGRKSTSIGRRFAFLCATPLVMLAVAGALYVEYRDSQERTAAQEQRAETHGSLLGLNASLFVLTGYDERFRTELDGVSVREADFLACRIFDVDGELLLEWMPKGVNPGGDFADVTVAKSPLFFDEDKLGAIEITFDMGRIHAELAAGRRIVIAWDLAILMGIIALCVREGRRLSKRIGGLTNIVEGIAGGDFERRAQEGEDEVGRLGIAFNRMAVDLGESIADQESARLLAVEAKGELEITYKQLQADVEIRERLEADLSQAKKLEAIGQLAAGIAHEINTPTQYVGDNIRFVEDSMREVTELLSAYSGLVEGIESESVSPSSMAEVKRLAEKCDLEYLLEELPLAIGQSLDGIGQVSEIVRAMKEFSHMGKGEELFDANLNEAIASTVIVARGEWRHVATVETEYDPTLPPVPCYFGIIKQVFLNLLINAAHAIADGQTEAGLGLIRVKTHVVDGMVEVRISDSGPGIPESIRDRIFEPFFTTKDVGRGSGQGLAIAYDCVTVKHGGSLSFETEVGVGTTFVMQLPLDREASPRTPA